MQLLFSCKIDGAVEDLCYIKWLSSKPLREVGGFAYYSFAKSKMGLAFGRSAPLVTDEASVISVASIIEKANVVPASEPDVFIMPAS